jgi:hypothetical protein
MHRYGSHTDRLAAGERYFLDTVVEFGHLAPRKLAIDEAHERMLVDAAQARLLNDAAAGPSGAAIIAALRQRLGQGLVLLGMRLQGAASVSAAPLG